MRRLIVTDTHLGLYSDADAWLDIVLNFYKHIVKYCIKNNITQLIHLGDFFDNRKSLNTKTQHTAHRIAKVLKLAGKLHTYIIVGNHDCYYKNQIQPNTLELFEQYKHITIIDKIEKLDDILLVPWGQVPEDNQGAKYCFGHFAINGFHMNDSYRCKSGLDSAKFKDFEKVISGHFHTPSNNHNVTYLGAPYGQTFHDANGIRGYHTFEDGKLEFIEYKDAPKFFKYNTANPCIREEIEDNVVKIIFDKNYGTNENQEIIDRVLELSPFLYSVNFTNIETDDPENDFDEDVFMDSKDKIAEQYIDSQLFSSNIKVPTLKAMFRNIMKEAGESRTKIKAAEGTRIECIDVGFKNFLSFGNKWQVIPLHNGVNFVTGIDKDKGKSNGAGKSSFLETIPFALFGKTAREIRQNQIVNWKNKKNCQVIFRFKINDDIYEINRQLKPNKLEIYKNEELIDQDAHKTDYQNMFENIFGMNVKMFMSLIHSNINSSANILNMKKEEKRKFLERMFGVEIYSDMNKICNRKIKDINEKKYKIEADIGAADTQIDTAMRMIIKFREEINSKNSSLEAVDDIKEQLDKLKENQPNLEEEILEVEKKIKDKEAQYNENIIGIKENIASEKSQIAEINSKISQAVRMEKWKKENEVINGKILAIIEKTGDIANIDDDIKKIEEEELKHRNLFTDANDAGANVYKEIMELNANLKVKQEGMDLIAEGKCPTCGADTNASVTSYKKEIASIKKKLTHRNKKYDAYDEEANKHRESFTDFVNKIKVLQRTKDRLNSLRSKIVNDELDFDKGSLISAKSAKEEMIENLVNSDNRISRRHASEMVVIENRYNTLKDDRDVIRAKQREYDMAVSKADEAKKHIQSLNQMIEEQDQKAKEVTSDIKELRNQKKKFNTLTDYINAIKVLLKDENIKQFTIKKIIPFMNKQTNHYLSEVNYGFYVKIDKWLDVEIKGPGIRNASYASLSGGERRGIDIAIQLSLLDISRTQAGMFPDLLVFDELLDSSIDSRGINELMKIVQTKQKEFGGKIFIISHRDEIDGEMVDNQYKVIKENGYSKVYV